MRPGVATLSVLPVLSVLFACPGAATALDIAGIVVDKVDRPVPGSRICLKDFPARCVETSTNGTFRITDAGVAIAGTGQTLPYSLEPLGPRMALTTPRAAPARILWLDAAGRALAPARRAELRAGRNLLDLPDQPRDGLLFMRVSLPGRTITGKTLMLGGSAFPGPAAEHPADPARSGTGAQSALSKIAAIRSDLVVTRDGFRPITYRPVRDVEADAYVVLRALSDSGYPFASTFTSKNTLDRDLGRWIVEDTVAECEGQVAVKTVSQDTSRFAVRDGTLYQYYPGGCRGQRLTGGGDDVVGTWTFAEFNVFLPADLRSDACRDTIPSDPVPPDMKGVVAITESQQTFTLEAEICPSDLYLELFLLLLVTDPTVELLRNTCRQASFRKGSGEEAVLDFAKQGDSLISRFTAGDRACRASEMMREGSDVPLDCVSEDPVDAFLECVGATAYFGASGQAPAAKRAAAAGGAAQSSPRFPRFGRYGGRVAAPAAVRWRATTGSRPGKVYISHP